MFRFSARFPLLSSAHDEAAASFVARKHRTLKILTKMLKKPGNRNKFPLKG